MTHLSLHFQLYVYQVTVHSSVCIVSSGFHKLATRTIWADLNRTRSDQHTGVCTVAVARGSSNSICYLLRTYFAVTRSTGVLISP